MSSCNCPPFENKTFYELISAFGLLGRKEKSKNCCEEAGYLCPNLDKALRSAYHKQTYVSKAEKLGKTYAPHKKKELKKRKLSLS